MESTILLTKEDVAAIFRVSQRTIEKWTVAGKLPSPHHMGRFPFWERESFLAWVQREFTVNPEQTRRPRQGRPRNHLIAN